MSKYCVDCKETKCTAKKRLTYPKCYKAVSDAWKSKVILCEDDATYDRLWSIIEREIKKAEKRGVIKGAKELAKTVDRCEFVNIGTMKCVEAKLAEMEKGVIKCRK